MDQIVQVENYRTRNLITRYNAETRKLTVEVVWKPEEIRKLSQELPKRRFVMSCRNLCGQDLKRIHFTCAMTYLGLGCKIRRSYYGQLPDPYELQNILLLKTLKRRRFPRLKDWLLKYALTLVENLLLN
jgi:hypothetical protein